MKKSKLLIPVLIGLMVGHLFAEDNHSVGVANTVRFGYDDNKDRSKDPDGSFFVTDIIDFSFRAALSERTDITVKSELILLDKDKNTELYPNLYAILNQGISPRLNLRFSEYYRSGEKTEASTQYKYFENKLGSSADYVLTGRDRLGLSLYDNMMKHDEEINTLDHTTIGVGTIWSRELAPQRTFISLNLGQSETVQKNAYRKDPSPTVVTNLVAVSTNSIEYIDHTGQFQQSDLSVGLNHTFNQNWQGSLAVGVSCIQQDYPDYVDTFSFNNLTNSTSSTTITTNSRPSESSLNPLLTAGLVYSPSPKTRLTGDFSLKHTAETSDENYTGNNTAELVFSAQHYLTAKLTAKATARFATVQRELKDAKTGTSAAANKTDNSENNMDLEFRLTYKLNRINFLELGLRHSETDKDSGDSWKQNVIDVGWRVDLK